MTPFRRGLVLRSWNKASCLRRNRFSATRGDMRGIEPLDERQQDLLLQELTWAVFCATHGTVPRTTAYSRIHHPGKSPSSGRSGRWSAIACNRTDRSVSCAFQNIERPAVAIRESAFGGIDLVTASEPVYNAADIYSAGGTGTHAGSSLTPYLDFHVP
jgi:hypothetical protein